MSYLMWRLHRTQVFLSAAAVAVLAALLLVTGTSMARDYHAFLASCAAAHNCGNTGHLFSGDNSLIALVYATIAIPLLFGMFWGAPLLASEFESGTHSLAWTQGITRRRWLTGAIGWALLAAAAGGAAIAVLVTWWRTPENAVGIPYSRFGPGLFDIQGIVPVAYSVFAVALGIAAGSIFRRVLPALATTLAVFTAVRVAILYLRPHYLTPTTKLVSFIHGPPPGAWIFTKATIGPHGQNYGSISYPSTNQVPAACRASMSPSCLASHGFHYLVTYQPVSRFWAFQGIEACIFLGLAAAAVALASWMVLNRDA
jgi:hypothetical protein